MAKKSTKVRVNVGIDKESVKARVDRAANSEKIAPTSPLYQQHADVKDACDTQVSCGATLSKLDEAAQAAELLAAKARSERDQAVIEYDAAHKMYVGVAERYAVKPEDLQGLGFEVLDRAVYPLVPPVGVRATFDRATHAIHIQVEHAPGMEHCLTEISTDQVEPRTWKRLRGMGVRPVVKNAAPGNYWVRAASLRADDESDFCEPVMVVVT